MIFNWKCLSFLSQRRWWLVVLFWMVLVAPVQAAVELRIAIRKNVNTVRIGSSTEALVKDNGGRVLGKLKGMDAFSAKTSSRGVAVNRWQGNQLWIEPTKGGYVWIGDNWYRGRIRLIRHGKGMIALNYIDLEHYLYSVVGAESIPSWPLEALKAQAVAARTYAIYKSRTSGNRFYDLDTTTRTQVYKGLKTEFRSTQQAVKTTTGEILSYRGQPILAAFHSSSGGHTENVEDVWSKPLPYLRGVQDYDQLAPVFQWQKTFSPNQLTRRIGGIGRVRALVPLRRSPKGRISTIRVVGSRGSKSIKGSQLRKALDLRSTLFTVTTRNGVFRIQGRGYGHGIGLSQWGSQYLAQEGVDYKRILSHYYQNTNLTQLTD